MQLGLHGVHVLKNYYKYIYMVNTYNERFNMMLCTKYSLAMGGPARVHDKTLV
jgi:hypothetical protein